MNKLWRVTRKEFRMMARTKLYVTFTAVGPFMIAALVGLPLLLPVIGSSSEGKTLAFVAAGPLLPAIQAELTPHGILVEGTADESDLASRVRAGDLDGYVVFPIDVFGTEGFRYVNGGAVDLNLSRLISNAVSHAVVQRRLQLEGFGAERIAVLTRRPQVQELVLDEDGEVVQDVLGSFLSVIAFIAMLFTILEVYGQALGRSVLSEKTARTAEIMLSSLPPFALLAGKILGKGLAGVLQYLVWVVISMAVVYTLGERLGVSVPSMVHADNFLALMGFFVLGFLLYAAAYAIAGAVATDDDNFSQLMWPVSAMQLVPLVLTLAVLNSPDSPLAVILSLIPVTAPMVMFTRVVVGNPGVVQIVVAVAGVMLVTAVAVWAASKAFRLGILLTGKKGTFREIVRLLRA